MKHHLIMSSTYTGGKETGVGTEILNAVTLSLEDVTVSEVETAQQAEEISRMALSSGADAVLVAADDEAINGAVNGFFDADGNPVVETPRLGILPTTMGGDIQRTADVPNHLMAAMSRITRNQPRPMDIGRVMTPDGKKRYFANAASAGVSALIGQDNKKADWLNAIGDDLSFNWSIFKNRLMHRRFPLHVSIPDGPYSMTWDANCVAICNGNNFGGGLKVAPDADYADGYLDVIIVHDYTKAKFFKSLKAIREDHDMEVTEGISSIRTKSILISSDDPEHPVPVDVDGVVIGNLPAKFDLVPQGALLL